MQYREMDASGKQTDKIITAANLIEAHQNQIVLDNKQVLSDNRKAIANTLTENRNELAAALKQNREALEVSAEQGKAAMAASIEASRLAQRPWIKIKHRIMSPLTFDVPRNGGQMAIMTIEDTMENIGQSVALNVLSWEDVIPVDLDHSTRTAQRRQSDYCDTNRHPDPRSLTGYALFPHDPFVQNEVVGPTMATIQQFTVHTTDHSRIDGTVAFVLVGCVFYRASFEPPNNPTHQTRFIYYLGVPQEFGFLPNVIPRGLANTLQLIPFPNGLTVD
jgi:hypothetical protein